MPTSIRKPPECKLATIDESQEDDIFGNPPIMCESKEQAQTLPLRLRNTTLLETIIKACSERWRNWLLRGIFSVLLIGYFWLTVYYGPAVIMATTLAIQVKCFAEIIDIGYKVYPVNEPPLFKLLSWYFLAAANYFCYGETLVDYFSVFVRKSDAFRLLVTYHRFVSFCMYFVGMVGFVLSIRRKYDMHQFSLLACTHVALLLVVGQSYMIVTNIFQGLIWLVVPVSSVACNDIMAYVFGNFFGKTPLIRVSPKKTWEGFIGAAVSTILYGCVISYILCQYPYFACPMEYVETMGALKLSFLELPEAFKLKNYTLRMDVPAVFQGEAILQTYPFVFHALVITLFSSLIAPFGGFFASGFKRAFNVKDFGETIPGHGGVLDRFDCQFLVATFVNVYITSFIKSSWTPEKIFSKVMYLKPQQQVQFFHLLGDSLKN